MNSLKVSTLERILRSPSADDRILLERYTRAGEPIYWEEHITIEHGALQRYVRIRSAADEGGAPIGIWQSATDAKAVQTIAHAHYVSQAWTLASSNIAPGEEVITWRYVINDETWQLSAVAGSPLLITLGNVDQAFRRVANVLVASGSGAAVVSELLVERLSDGVWNASIALINRGKQDCFLQNPLIAKGSDDYLRIEVGSVPSDPPGTTGLGIQYEPLAMRVTEPLPERWKEPLLMLKAGERLICPVQNELRSAALRGYFARAVYSHYGNPLVKLALPVVRGRVFSTEQRLSF
jgi:hypothetical protein